MGKFKQKNEVIYERKDYFAVAWFTGNSGGKTKPADTNKIFNHNKGDKQCH